MLIAVCGSGEKKQELLVRTGKDKDKDKKELVTVKDNNRREKVIYRPTWNGQSAWCL